jgi:hypothetical protein
LASLFLIYGVVYPCLAGLDGSRQALYLNLCALALLLFAAWQLRSATLLKLDPCLELAEA